MLGVFIVFIVGGLFFLFLIRNIDGLLCKYVYVPEGDSWEQVFRKMRERKLEARPGWLTWLVIGGGVGMGLIGLLLELLK